MSMVTNLLKLFKYEPGKDDAQTFNLDAALNENWDKVDDAVAELGKNKADLDSLTGKVKTEQLPPLDYEPAGSVAQIQAQIEGHVENKNNPHATTAVQVGAAALVHEHPELISRINANAADIQILRDAVFSNITSNPFRVSFESLSGVVVGSGVWNTAYSRLEC